MPCVFIPYYVDNVRDLYKSGRKLEDALQSDLFRKGREWQTKYLGTKKKPGNMLMPCFIRDHHKEFYEAIKSCKKVLPEDECAKQAIKDEKWHKMIYDFDKKLANLTEPYWKKEYIKKDKK